jgi:predicted metal-dependent HD superfamily phosphohydrolase
LLGGEKHQLRRLHGSKFRISASSDSPGIQVVDTILWLFKRVINQKKIGSNSASLMNYVFSRGYQTDLSFEAVGKSLKKYFEELNDQPLTEEAITRARMILDTSEQRRQAEMAAYAEEKLHKASSSVD